MKKLLIFIALIFYSFVSTAQKNSIVGAWHWSNEKITTSLFIREDNSIERFDGLVGEMIVPERLLKGVYKRSGNRLKITWVNKNISVYYFLLIQPSRLQVKMVSGKGKLSAPMLFGRVVDEEVVPDK